MTREVSVMASVPAGLWQTALERVDCAVLITDATIGPPGPRIVYANAAFLEMTGYPGEEILGQTPRMFQGPDTDPAELRRLRRALEVPEACAGEVVNYRRDGSSFLLQWRVEPLRDDDGRATHFLAATRDITALRRQERRRDELEILARIQREIAAGGLDLDAVRRKVADAAMRITGADGAVVEEPDEDAMVYRAAAGAASRHLGMRVPMDASVSGLCHRRLETIVCDDTATDDRVATEPARAVGFRSGVLVPLCQGDRCYGVLKVFSSLPAHFSAVERDHLQLASGVLASALGAAYALRSEVERRAMLVDALPIFIAYIDRDGRLQEMNAACERWFGLPRAQLAGRELRGVLGDTGFAAIKPYMEAALRGEPVHFETRATFPSGDAHYLEGDYTPDRDDRGRVRGFHAVIRDVTDLQTLYTDYLTKINNRRRLEEKGETLIAFALRYHRPLSLIMMDIDRFKSINDSHGHQAGDVVLRQLAQILSEGVRAADLLARWGGEEFVILAPETTELEAAAFAERIRERVSSHEFAPVGRVTLSMGIAELADSEQALAPFQERADQALYRAKHAGRNRVLRYGAQVTPAPRQTGMGN